MAYRAAKTVVALLAVAPLASAHSWVEFLRRIKADGSYAASTGYPIPYIARGAPGYSDDAMLNKILDKETNPSVCKQGNFQYSQDAPRLNAAAGDYLAMLYQENGHVTQPDITPRPFRGGNVYIYGTLKDVKSTGINDVLYSWNAQGTGGDKRGQLLATHFFDDGQCYQDTGGVDPDPAAGIYTARHNKFGVDAVSCQSAVQLPSDLPNQGIYNLMWVWDWPLITSETTNVTETYTSCAEIQLGPKKSGSQSRIEFAAKVNVTDAAIKSQVHTLIEAITLGEGTNSPPAPTATAPGSGGSPGSPSSPTTTTTGASATTGPATVTVTVTAKPVTTTVYATVTVGNTQDSTSVPPALPTLSLPLPFPTADQSLAPTDQPSQFLPGFPTDVPSIFPTLPLSSFSFSTSALPSSTLQTSAQTSSSSASSSSAVSISSASSSPVPSSSTVTFASASTSSPSSSSAVVAAPTSSSSAASSSAVSVAPTSSSSSSSGDGPLPGFPAVTTRSASSQSESISSTVTSDKSPLPGFSTRSSASAPTASSTDEGPLPGFPTVTSVSSTSDAVPVSSASLSRIPSEASSTNAAASSTSSSGLGPLPGFPTHTRSSRVAESTSSVENFPTPGFPTEVATLSSAVATASSSVTVTASSRLPSTFQTLVRPSSSSSSSSSSVASSAHFETLSTSLSTKSSSSEAPAATHEVPTTSSSLESSTSESRPSHTSTEASTSLPAVTPNPTSTPEPTHSSSATTTLVPVTSVTGFL